MTREHRLAATFPATAIALNILAVVVVTPAALTVTGCGSANPPETDAATRPDAGIVETGLEFDDAPTPPEDAPSGDDAASRDGGLMLCRGACDPVHGTGCAMGQMCAVRAAAAECGEPARGRRGTPCASHAECGLGLACFRDPSGAGVCDRVCCPGGADCATAESCGGDGVLVDGTRSSWGRCLAPRTCALLEPASCPEREACYVVGAAGETECLLAGTALEGNACTLPNDCADGLVCAGAFDRTCARLCRLGLMEDPCGSGAMCVRQAYTPDGIGVCVAASAPAP